MDLNTLWAFVFVFTVAITALVIGLRNARELERFAQERNNRIFSDALVRIESDKPAYLCPYWTVVRCCKPSDIDGNFPCNRCSHFNG